MVKDPASRNEVSTPAQPALLHAPEMKSTAPAHAPVNRLDNPALVAATKLEAQSPIAQSPTSRLDNPVLVAATKLESQTNAAQASIPQSAVRVESAPILVAAAKSEPGSALPNRPEASQLQPGPVVQTIASVSKAEPVSTQSAVANPFQSIKQVVARNEVVLEGTGKVVLNESVSSPAPSC
ncbi:MAG: hypothetical protein IPJ49_20115 [Candidatus Obscuribacter sp.]|nr:hypothetical protein [Candidatus Obscuribacter sp.]